MAKDPLMKTDFKRVSTQIESGLKNFQQKIKTLDDYVFLTQISLLRWVQLEQPMIMKAWESKCKLIPLTPPSVGSNL